MPRCNHGSRIRMHACAGNEGVVSAYMRWCTCMCPCVPLADVEGELLTVLPAVGALPNGTPLFLCCRLGDADLDVYNLPAGKPHVYSLCCLGGAL